MEAAAQLHHPRVTVHGERVEIDGLVVLDEALARLVRETSDPDRVATDALEIGARVLDREQTAANAEFVRTEFEKVAKTVETEFGERARLVGEQLDEKLGDVFDPERGQLARSLTELFSDGSSKAVQNRTKEMVAELLRGSREDLLKLFAAGDGSNPLAALGERTVDEIRAADKRQREGQQMLLDRVHQLEKQLQGLRDEKEKLEEVARERERGTAKGRTYEESLADALDAIAGPQGDVADPVGDEAGAGGRKGDVVVLLDAAAGPPRGRIVFEAKDSKLSKPAFHEQLDAAREQRDADYAVLVVPGEDEVPAKLHSLREYLGDKMIAVYDPDDGSTLELEFAYRVARARVAMAREGRDEVDAAALRAAVGRALDAVDGVRKVKSQLTSAEGCIGNARELLETLSAEVRRHLAELDAVLAPAAE